jgi:hypothetical protein
VIIQPDEPKIIDPTRKLFLRDDWREPRDWRRDFKAGSFSGCCCTVSCSNCTNGFPTTLNLAITASAGSGTCPGLNGVTIPLTYDPVNNWWASANSIIGTNRFLLTCSGSGVSGITLVFQKNTGGNPTNCVGVSFPGGAYSQGAQSGSTCSPVSLHYAMNGTGSADGTCTNCTRGAPNPWSFSLVVTP